MDSPPPLNLTDHDLLIRLDTRMSNLTDEMRLLRDGTTGDIKDLKENKLDRREFEEYKRERDNDRKEEARVKDEHFDKLDKKTDRIVVQMAAIGGALVVLEFVIPLVLKYYFHA